MRLLLLLPLLADLCGGFSVYPNRAPRAAGIPAGALLARKSRRRTVTDELEALQRGEGDEPGSGDQEDAAAGIDEGTRAKLKAEIASPFRRLRQFFYVAAGMAGGLGTASRAFPTSMRSM